MLRTRVAVTRVDGVSRRWYRLRERMVWRTRAGRQEVAAGEAARVIRVVAPVGDQVKKQPPTLWVQLRVAGRGGLPALVRLDTFLGALGAMPLELTPEEVRDGAFPVREVQQAAGAEPDRAQEDVVSHLPGPVVTCPLNYYEVKATFPAPGSSMVLCHTCALPGIVEGTLAFAIAAEDEAACSRCGGKGAVPPPVRTPRDDLRAWLQDNLNNGRPFRDIVGTEGLTAVLERVAVFLVAVQKQGVTPTAGWLYQTLTDLVAEVTGGADA